LDFEKNNGIVGKFIIERLNHCHMKVNNRLSLFKNKFEYQKTPERNFENAYRRCNISNHCSSERKINPPDSLYTVIKSSEHIKNWETIYDSAFVYIGKHNKKALALIERAVTVANRSSDT
jgi:hypothetical protein